MIFYITFLYNFLCNIFRYRLYVMGGINKMRDKSKMLEMIILCEKIGYIMCDEVFYHILKFLPDEKILSYIEKNNLLMDDVIPFIVKNKLWNILTNIFSDKKYKYSEDEYLKNIYKLFNKIKTLVSVSEYLSIYNYHIAKYKLKPTISLKKVALNAVDINFVKKLVEKYNFKYTLANVTNYISKINRRKNGWNYNNHENKIYRIVLIINYLSNKFDEIKLIYENNKLYESIRKISCRINDKTILYLLKNNQMQINQEVFFKMIHRDLPDSLKYILNNNNNNAINIKKTIISSTIISNNNLITLFEHMINKNNEKLKQDELLYYFLNGFYGTKCLIYLIDTKILEINTKIITLLVLDTIENCYDSDILIKALYLCPTISAKVFDYIQRLIIIIKQEKYSKTKHQRYSPKARLLQCLINIVEMKNQLTITDENEPLYKFLNIEIDENNLIETQYNFACALDNYNLKIENLVADSESNNESDDETNNESDDETNNESNESDETDETEDELYNIKYVNSNRVNHVNDANDLDKIYDGLNYPLTSNKVPIIKNKLTNQVRKKINIID